MAKAMQFDVGMDNGEFMRGSKDIARAISSLKSTVAAACKSMNSSASGYGQAMRQSIRASREFEQSVENIKSRMDELRTSTASIKASADSFNTFKKSIENAEAEMGKLLEQQKQLIDMGAGGPSDAWNQNQAEIAKVTAELEKQQQAYYDYAAAVEYAEKRLSTGKDEWGHQLSDEEKKTYDEEANYNVELANQAVERIEAAEAALESLKQTQAELAANGEDGPTQEFIDLTEEISNAESRLVDMKSILENMRSAGYENADRSDVYRDQISELQDLENELDNARAKKEEALKPPYMQSWEQMITVSGMISEGFGRIQNAAAGALYAIQHSVQAVDRALGTLIVKATQAAATFARMAGNAALSFLRRLASEAQNAAIQLAKIASNAVHGAFQKLAQGASAAGKGLLGLIKNNKAADGSFKRGFMTIMKYAFGVRSMYFLFRRLRTAITQAFQEMAKSSPEVKSAINGLQTALNGLKGSLASAFAPIFTAVAPALIYLINMLTAAMNALSAFFAALTGQSSYKKAVGGMKSVGSGAGKSAKQVKELKRELMGFDELNILHDDKDNGGGGGGGGGGSAMRFVDQQIPGGIKDFVDKLKELWNNKEYVKIGKLIADWINNAIETAKELITWENVSTKIQEFVDAIAGIMEGILTYVDWKNIGDTIAEALRTVTNTIDTFMSKVGLFMLAGSALAALVNGFFGNKKLWTDIGKTITDSVHSFLAFGQAFLDGFDAEEAGRGIRSAILTVEEQLPAIASEFWELVKTAFNKTGSFVNALLGGGQEENYHDASRFMREKPITVTPKYTVADSVWDELATNLATGFNSVVEKLTNTIENQPVGETIAVLAGWITKVKNGINWEAVGNIIGASFQKALEGIGAAIASFAENAQTTGEDLGKAINEAIRKVKWFGEGDDTVQGIITNSFKGAIGLVKGLFGKFDTAEFVKSLKGALEGVPWGDIAKDIWDFITEELAKLGNILNTLLGGGVEVKPEVVKPSQKKSGMVPDTGTGTPANAGATVNASELFTKISTTVLEAIKWAVDNIPWEEWGTKVHDWIVDIDWGQIALDVWELVKSALSGIEGFINTLIFGENYTENPIYNVLTLGIGKWNKEADAAKEKVAAVVEEAEKLEEVDLTPIKTIQNALNGNIIDVDTGKDLDVSQILQMTGWDKWGAETQAEMIKALGTNYGGTENAMNIVEALGYDVTAAKEAMGGLGTDAATSMADGYTNTLTERKDEMVSAVEDPIVEANQKVHDDIEMGSPSALYESYGNSIVDGLIIGLQDLPSKLQTIWEALPEWAQTMFASLGKTLGIDINANASGGNSGNSGGDSGAGSKDTRKNTKASKKETKETQKNTKELKKNTAKRGEVDVNYEGAGFDTSGDKPKLTVGVDFVPGDEGTEASDENKNGGLLGWLQELLNADTLEAKIALIRDNWESVANWMYNNGYIGDTLMQLINLGKQGNWNSVVDWFEKEKLIGPSLAQLIKLAKDGKWTDVVDWFDREGFFGPALSQVVALAKQGKWKDVLDWFKREGYLSDNIEQLVDLVKKGDWTGVIDWLSKNKLFGPKLEQLVDLVKKGDWTGVIDWLEKSKLFGPALQQLVGLIKDGNWTGVIDWLKSKGLFGATLAQLVSLAKDGNWTGIIDWLKKKGLAGPAFEQLVQLVKDNWKTFLGFLGIDTSNPLIQTLVDLLFGKEDKGAKETLAAEDKDVDVNVDLEKGQEDKGAKETLALGGKSAIATVIADIARKAGLNVDSVLGLFGWNKNVTADKPTLANGVTSTSAVGLFSSIRSIFANKPTLADGVTKTSAVGLFSSIRSIFANKPTLADGVTKTSAVGLFSSIRSIFANKPTLADGVTSTSAVGLFSSIRSIFANKPTLADGVTSTSAVGLFSSIRSIFANEPTLADGVTSTSAVNLFTWGKKVIGTGAERKKGVAADVPTTQFTWGKKVIGTGAERKKGVAADIPTTKFTWGKKVIGTGAERKKGVAADIPTTKFTWGKKVIGTGAERKKGVAADIPTTKFTWSKKVIGTGAERKDGVAADAPTTKFTWSKKVSASGASSGGVSKNAITALFNWSRSVSAEKPTFASHVSKTSVVDMFNKTVSVSASLSSSSAQALKSAATKALKGIKVTVKAKSDGHGGANIEVPASTGGVIANGRFHRFALGGVISGGLARYLSNVPHYAGGTTRAHGTVFVAGEAGPEIMGHINGRTEILNKSQIAEAIYAAVVSGVGAAVNALGKYIANHMTNCTNAIVQTIGANTSYMPNVEYYAPAMATGGIMPYDVTMQIARSTQELQNTLDSNNEELIQAMISAVGNAAQSIVQAMTTQMLRNSQNRTMSTRQIVDDINRASQMFGQSPIKGV